MAQTIKQRITALGLRKHLRKHFGVETVILHRENITLEGVLLFGDIRDRGIVADQYRKDRTEMYYVAGPTRTSVTPRGISKHGTRSRQYDAWNVPIQNGDVITIGTYRKRSYVVRL